MQAILSWWLPIDASAHGWAIDRLMVMIHWLMVVLFVGWTIYFIYVLVRFREGRNPEASYEGAKTHFSTWVEGGVAVVEALLLAVFAVPFWSAWIAPPPASENPVRVRVVAEQFAWNIHYPGPDETFGRTDIDLVAADNPLGLDRSDPAARDDVTTINQLHLPVDREVSVLLSSKDVVHSFFLPVMRVKQDTIPGMQIPVHFRPVQVTPEEARFPACSADKSCWEIACSQLCGLGHFRMRGFLTIHTQEGFAEWMDGKVAALPSMRRAAPGEDEGEEAAEPSVEEGETRESSAGRERGDDDVPGARADEGHGDHGATGAADMSASGHRDPGHHDHHEHHEGRGTGG